MQRQNLDENGAFPVMLHRNYTWIRKPKYATYCTITNIPTTTIVCPMVCVTVTRALRINKTHPMMKKQLQ